MNMATVEQIAKNPNTQWYLNLNQTAALLGCSVRIATIFLHEHSIPYYRIGKSKSYFLGDIIAEIEKTRWKDSKNGGKNHHSTAKITV